MSTLVLPQDLVNDIIDQLHLHTDIPTLRTCALALLMEASGSASPSGLPTTYQGQGRLHALRGLLRPQ
jgi:hypothetical protein